MAEQFAPQYQTAMTKPYYVRVPLPYGKRYHGCFRTRISGQVKISNKHFNTATDAVEHTFKVISRYRRLIDAKLMTMINVDQPA